MKNNYHRLYIIICNMCVPKPVLRIRPGRPGQPLLQFIIIYNAIAYRQAYFDETCTILYQTAAKCMSCMSRENKILTHIFDNRLKRKYGKWSKINSHTGANGTRRANTNNTNQTYRYNVHSCCLITKQVNKIWLNCDFNYITIAAVQLRF